MKEGADDETDFGIRVGALPAALPFTAAAAGTGSDRIPFAEEGSACTAGIERRSRRASRLFTPMNGEGTVYLMDLNGKIVHTWEIPYPPGLYGY